MLNIGKIHGLIFFVCCCTQIAAQSDLEASALTDLAIQYDTLQTLGWNTNGTDVCNFKGVTCNEEGNVTRLDLSHFNFDQNLPETFGDLNHLEWLDIHYNNFNSLPSSFSNLQKLKTLSVRGCFENNLPEEIFSLSKVEKLDVSQNHLTHLDSKIDQLTKLEQLICSENDLQTLPIELANLDNLTNLYINRNLFETIPTHIKEMSSLIALSMKDNQINTIDPSFFNSNTIQYLYLDNNNISQIPSTIGETGTLKQLYLDGNHLESLPEEITSLEYLETISLSFNDFKSIPCELGEISSLVNLYLKDNQIDAVNDCLLNSEQLYFLTLQGNNLGFEDLEQFLGIVPFYIYAPQDSILSKEQIYLLPGTEVQLQSGYDDPAHRYKWYKNGELISGATNSSLIVNYDSLATGDYTCSIVNTNLLALELWRNEIKIELIEPIKLTASEVKHVSCYGGNNGQINVLATGATNNFDYQWSNSVTTSNLENLSAGQYSLTVTDQTVGLELVETYIVEEPTPIVVQESIISTTNTSLGSITLNVQGGTAPYTYNWNNDLAEQASQESLDYGYYQVEIIDANGCNQILDWNFDMSTSINETIRTELNNIEFFPNPTTSSVYLESDNLELVHFELIDARGQKVLSSSFRKTTCLDISHLSSGIYFLNIEESENVFTSKNNRLIKL